MQLTLLQFRQKLTSYFKFDCLEKWSLLCTILLTISKELAKKIGNNNHIKQVSHSRKQLYRYIYMSFISYLSY